MQKVCCVRLTSRIHTDKSKWQVWVEKEMEKSLCRTSARRSWEETLAVQSQISAACQRPTVDAPHFSDIRERLVHDVWEEPKRQQRCLPIRQQLSNQATPRYKPPKCNDLRESPGGNGPEKDHGTLHHFREHFDITFCKKKKPPQIVQFSR